jgi:hypothetical protein
MDISANDLMWDFFQQHPLSDYSAEDQDSKKPQSTKEATDKPSE